MFIFEGFEVMKEQASSEIKLEQLELERREGQTDLSTV